MVFVLGVDYEQLGCSVRSLFGNDLIFPEYFRKFSHRQISLPKSDRESLKRIVQHYTDTYLIKEGVRVCTINLQNREKNIVDLIDSLGLSPRQMQEVFRIIGHLVAAEEGDKSGGLKWGYEIGAILMATLKVQQNDLFNRIGKGEATHIEVGRFLVEDLKLKDADWWFSVYYYGTDPHADNLEKISLELGLLEEGESLDRNRNFGGAWSQSLGDQFQRIYKNIEAVTAIADEF
jgi:hypothetical protein